jgi:hypothetical protein
MKSIPVELIFYVLVFGAFLLFQYIRYRFGLQQQLDSAQHELPREVPEEAHMPTSPATSAAVGKIVVASALAPLPKRRFSRRSLMGTKREVQNAIVITTVLGPCRAFEPHNVG